MTDPRPGSGDGALLSLTSVTVGYVADIDVLRNL